MSLLEVESLDQFYRDFQALFRVTLRVDEGEIVAIIGANGAGKSTFLKTVAGLVVMDRWNVRFFPEQLRVRVEDDPSDASQPRAMNEPERVRGTSVDG